MNMKKLTCFFLITVLVLALSACGGHVLTADDLDDDTNSGQESGSQGKETIQEEENAGNGYRLVKAVESGYDIYGMRLMVYKDDSIPRLMMELISSNSFSGEPGEWALAYDDSGKLISVSYSNEDGGKNGEILLTLDDQGRELSKVINNNSENVLTETWAYNADGVVHYEEYLAGEAFLRSDSTYNEDGKLISEETISANGQHRFLSQSYTSSGKRQQTSISTEDDSGNIAEDNTYYEYDANDRIIRETYDSFYNGESYLKTVTEYFYNDNGNLLSRIKTAFDPSYGSERLERKVTYSYDNDGHLLEEKVEDEDGIQGSTEYSYDEKGNAVSIITYDYSGVYQFEKKSIESCTYYPDGTIKTKTLEDMDHFVKGNWEFDENGNLILYSSNKIGESSEYRVEYFYEQIK